jgi:hypothetical protein
MIWKEPPVIKVYEALGALGDKRVEVEGNTAKVWSSSGNKHYDVLWDPEIPGITANDNGSFYQGYLGYPMVAFLMAKGVLQYNTLWADTLAGFAWKDINVKYKNDWKKTADFIRGELEARGHDLAAFDLELDSIMTQIRELKLERLRATGKPPTSY